MKCIFQVLGRLDGYDEIRFQINGNEYEECLAAYALKRYFEDRGEKAEITFLVPESLIEREEQLDSIKNADVKVIPAIGEYIRENRRVKYVSTIDSVVTSIFLHFLDKKPDEIFVDVSTGHNVYPISMLEAARRYVTYRRLEKIVQGKTPTRLYTVFIPPISKGVRDVRVEIQRAEVKAFFSLPNANPDRVLIGNNGISEINRRFARVKGLLRRLLRELKIAFNSLRLNVPLSFYTEEILDMSLDVDIVEEGLKEFVIEALKPIKHGDIVERFKIDGVNVANLFYSIALYRSIKEFKDGLSEPEVNEIYERFSDAYDKLGLDANKNFLRRDIENIKMDSKRLADNEEVVYAKLRVGNVHGSSDVKRNFFAHSGFLMESTIIKKRGGKIFIKWDKSRINEIKSWLEKP